MGCGLDYSYHEHTIIVNVTVTTVISFLYMQNRICIVKLNCSCLKYACLFCLFVAAATCIT